MDDTTVEAALHGITGLNIDRPFVLILDHELDDDLQHGQHGLVNQIMKAAGHTNFLILCLPGESRFITNADASTIIDAVNERFAELESVNVNVNLSDS